MIAPLPSPESGDNNELLSQEQLESILAAGALDAIRENQRFGLPFVTERDGRIIYLDPFEAEADLLKSYPALATQQIPPVGPFQTK